MIHADQPHPNSQILRASLVLLFICLSVFITWQLKPTFKLSSLNSGLRLEDAIPTQFDDWRQDSDTPTLVINPQQASLLNTLYSQTLTRNYINSKNQRIMLSIAYGAEQSGDIELHRPEVCYVAQGFALKFIAHDKIDLTHPLRPLAIQRLVADQGPRHEPISYWIRVGDDIIESGTAQQISRVRHGLKGQIPDGILFRISSIDSDNTNAYQLQDQFIKSLFSALPQQTQHFLAGPVNDRPEKSSAL